MNIVNPSSIVSLFVFFFLMIRPPPRSPLFPYPTPFRSLDDAAGRRGPARRVHHPHDRGASDRRARHTGPSGGVSRGALPALRRWKDHAVLLGLGPERQDRKSTRLNSSHLVISYAVFCLK